ncbi:MAG: hypothetical protein DBP02_16585 [gamma proteobacterium symbiont of Ctena orbiculata]|nr:MAG: hypothetical protein DBP02_16585 [gamma proteobacterium symbiont of Ctena orbiculata]
MFAGGGIAVMARLTGIGNPAMIESRDRPAIRGMTHIALGIGIDMGRMLAGGLDTVVTAGAYTRGGYRTVVKCHPQP